MSLSRCLNTAPRLHQACLRTSLRGFAAAVPAKTFSEVKFVKEDTTKVMDELPEFNFYEMKDPVPNVYKGVSMSTDIVLDPVAPKAVAPELKLSKLENGLKIASIDKQGLTACVGLVVHAGSRFEKPEQSGVAHMVELMAYKSTAHLSNLRTVKTFEQLGATATCTAGREVIAYKVDILREFVPIAVPLLVGNVLFPRFLPWELKSAKKGVAKAKAALEDDPDAYIAELVRSTAFCNNTIGIKPSASDKSLALDGDAIRGYLLDHFSPDKMALVGINVSHDELAKWGMRSFAEYNAIPSKPRPDTKPTYTGGYTLVEAGTGLCAISLGFEGVASGSAEVGALLVLESLIGAGAGSNLAKAGVSATAAAELYSDTGLFTITGVCEPADAPGYIAKVGAALKASGDVARAKATAKAKVAVAAEDKSALVDSLAASILTDKVVSTAELIKMVDAVTDAQVASVAKKVFASEPTIVAHGDINSVPAAAAIKAALSGAAK